MLGISSHHELAFAHSQKIVAPQDSSHYSFANRHLIAFEQRRNPPVAAAAMLQRFLLNPVSNLRFRFAGLLFLPIPIEAGATYAG